LRASNWTAQEAAGLGFITAGDFSFYDHMLDHAVLLGCVPSRFGFATGRLEFEDYFCARARQRSTTGDGDDEVV
jgi:5-methyltetrahydropteroyltriglutamate--homocysteine methyltransferase